MRAWSAWVLNTEFPDAGEAFRAPTAACVCVSSTSRQRQTAFWRRDLADIIAARETV
jgi:hypothetical protein